MTPMSSQWPVIVSLPGPSGFRRPWTTGASAGGTPSSGRIEPSPRLPSTGRSSPPAASETWPSVLEPASPYSAASGNSPAPQASRTTTKARRFTPAIVSGDLWVLAACARMGVEVDVLQALGEELRVELRRRHVRVPEHLLQRAEVAASRQQVGREGVAQRVRAHLARQPGGGRVALDDLVEALAREAVAAVVDEQPRLVVVADQLRAAAAEVGAERARGGGADRHHPLLGALAAGAQDARLEVEVADLEVDRLGGPQTAGVHDLEQRAVAERGRLGARRLGEQLRHLVAREHLRELAGLPRRLQLGGRVVLDQVLAPQMAVEGAQARDLALQRRGLGARLVAAALGELGDELVEPGVVEVEGVAPRALEPVPELQQVGAVGLERVAGEPALELEVGEEVEHEMLIRLDAVCDGHGEVFATAGRSACRCNGPFSRRSLGGAARAARSASSSPRSRR